MLREPLTTQHATMGRMRRIPTWLTAASPVAPGVVVLWFGFNSGGFFPEAPAVVAVALALFCVLRLTLADEPLAGISVGVVAVAALLAAFGVWILASSKWSHTPARSLLEFNRLLAYLLGVLAFGSLARTPERLAQAVRFLALAMVILAGAGLITRTLPAVWSITPTLSTDRLSYPLTYWNALGLLCGLGMVLAVHLTTSGGEPRVVRLSAAAATPILAATAYLTFSRGGMSAGVLAVAVFLLVGRPRYVLSGLLAVVVPCAATLLVALHTDALGTAHPRSPAGVAAGHKLIEVVAVAMLAAAVLRLFGLWFDAWLDRRIKDRRPWPAWRTAAVYAVGIAAVAVVLVGARAPAFAKRQYHRFVDGSTHFVANRRARLLDPSNDGRIDLWRVSWRAFKAHPLDGVGAGTFQTTWFRKRPNPTNAVDGHSLYLETLGELGIPGLALVLAAILLVLTGFLLRARGAGRGPPAALLAAGIGWAIHAGIDWDWEMPALTWWLFAFGAMALAAPADRPLTRRTGPPDARRGRARLPGRGRHAGARLPLADEARRCGQELPSRELPGGDRCRAGLGGCARRAARAVRGARLLRLAARLRRPRGAAAAQRDRARPRQLGLRVRPRARERRERPQPAPGAASRADAQPAERGRAVRHPAPRREQPTPLAPHRADAHAADPVTLSWRVDRARRGGSGALNPQSALAGLNSLSRG